MFQVHGGGDEYIHIRVYENFPCYKEDIELTSIEHPKTHQDPIEYFWTDQTCLCTEDMESSVSNDSNPAKTTANIYHTSFIAPNLTILNHIRHVTLWLMFLFV